MPEGGAIATAFVEVRAQTDNFGADLEAKTRPHAEQVGRSIASTIGNAIVAERIGRSLAESLGDANEAVKGVRQTEAAIRSTGQAANVTAGDIDTLTGSLSRKAAVDDDVIRSGTNMLLTFTRVRNEVGEGNDIFDRGTEAALNMSVALGQDMSSAAMVVGKALNDPIAGLTALTRAGIQFTDQQKEQIRAMVEAGDTLGAQQIILAELETQFGGSAEAQATSLDRITVASGNMKEAVGGALLPTVDAFVPVAEGMLDVFEAMPTPLQTATVGVAGLIGVVGPAGRAIEGLRSVRSVFTGAAEGAEVLQGSTSRVTSALGGLSRVALPAVGAAVGIGILALSDYNETKAEAARISGLLADALDREAEGLQGEVDTILATELATGELGTKLREAGTDFAVLTDAVRNQGDAIESLDDDAAAVRDTYLTLADALDRAGLSGSPFADELLRIAEAADLNDGEIAQLLNQLDGLSDRYSEQTTEAANVAAATGDVGDSAEDAATDLQTLRDALDQASDAYRRLYGETLTATEADLAYQEALDRLTDSIVGDTDTVDDNSASLDRNTERGRENTDAAIAAGEAIADLISLRFRETGSTEEARAAGELYVENLRNQLRQAGLTEEQVAAYIDTLNLTPEEIDTILQASIDEAALADAEAELNHVARDRRTTIRTVIEEGTPDRVDRLLAGGLFSGDPADASDSPFAAEPEDIEDRANSMSRLYGETLTAIAVDADWQENLDRLTESIKANGVTLDARTEQGRANIDAGIAVGQSITDLIALRYQETGSLDEARRAAEWYTEALRVQLRQAGLSEAAVAAYIDTLNLMPEDINRILGAGTTLGFAPPFGMGLPQPADTAVAPPPTTTTTGAGPTLGTNPNPITPMVGAAFYGPVTVNEPVDVEIMVKKVQFLARAGTFR